MSSKLQTTLKMLDKNIKEIPFIKHWKKLSSVEEFQEADCEILDLLWLKNAGLSYDEIELYQASEVNLISQYKAEPNAMEVKLEAIYNKMEKYATDSKSSEDEDSKYNKSNADPRNGLFKSYQKNKSVHPNRHPMNLLKEIEVDVFGYLHSDDILPSSKRTKTLRGFERKKNRVVAHEKIVNIAACGLNVPLPLGYTPNHIGRRRLFKMDINYSTDRMHLNHDYLNKDRAWHMHSLPPRNRNDYHPGQKSFSEHPDHWRNRKAYYQGHLRYSFRDEKKFANQDQEDEDDDVELPAPEAHLLEGTKMSIDNIKKIRRFRYYEPGSPSNVLHLKNIATEVSEEQVLLLFNQFCHKNGHRVNVWTANRLVGQAFVEFRDEYISSEALSEVNGTILSGQPIVAKFARAADIPVQYNR